MLCCFKMHTLFILGFKSDTQNNLILMYQNTNTAPYFNANLKLDRFTSIIGISLDRAFRMRQNSDFQFLFIFLYLYI